VKSRSYRLDGADYGRDRYHREELIARAIHKGSQRAGQAFIRVNCAPHSFFAYRLRMFGHERGPSPGPATPPGVFWLAHSGTIFLDESATFLLKPRYALLRVLQERQFEGGVGGSRVITIEMFESSPLLIAIWGGAIASGTFRSDLFCRLNICPDLMSPSPAAERRHSDAC